MQKKLSSSPQSAPRRIRRGERIRRGGQYLCGRLHNQQVHYGFKVTVSITINMQVLRWRGFYVHMPSTILNEPSCNKLRGILKLNFCFPLSFPFVGNPSDLFGILKKDSRQVRRNPSGKARMTEKGDPVASYREYPV